MPITKLLHVSLIVSDIRRSLSFYCETLGLSPAERPELDFPGGWLSVGEQQIHLLELANPDPVDDRPEHAGRDRHTAFAVDNLDELAHRLQAVAIPFTRSRSGRAAIFCRDPDGNGIELVQAEPNRQATRKQTAAVPSVNAKPGFFMDEIVNAYIYNEGAPYGEPTALICVAALKIIFCNDTFDGYVDEKDVEHSTDECIPLPHKNELDLGKRLVFNFIREMFPGDANSVERMFSRRGAYRRFRSFLEERDILDLWYDYENSAQEAALRSWCEWHDIPLKD